MDNLTHSLIGALIGQAGLKKKTGLAMPALIIGANIPDVDASCFLWLDGLEHLGFRRGITHGPPALVLLPLMLAGLLWAYDRWQTRRGKRPESRLPMHFGWLYALSFIACLTHPAMDWMNNYGVRLLSPFSQKWFYGDVLFIIDLVLWLLLSFGVWASLRAEKAGREWMRGARIVGVVALAYIGLNSVISARAAPHEGVIASPVPFLFWQREMIVKKGEGRYKVDGRAVGACDYAEAQRVAGESPDLTAFTLWSRAPFADRAEDGSVILRDARYTDPRARGSFSLPLPHVKCVPASKND